MQEQNFDIERWDVILSGCSGNKTPVVYIKPTPELLGFWRDKEFKIICTIKGSNSAYDELGPMIGMASPSAMTPCARPNFYEKTGWYTISLDSLWMGYPSINGRISFEGFTYTPEGLPTWLDDSVKYQIPKFSSTMDKKYSPFVSYRIKCLGVLILTGVLIYLLAKKQ